MIEANGPGAVTLGVGDRASAIAAVKAALRIASDDEDDLIAAFAETALGLAEGFTGQVLIARTIGETIDAGGWEAIGAMPVRAVTGVVNADGIALPVGDYAVDIDADGTGWVRSSGRITVTFEAGACDDWGALPAPIRQGVTMLAAHLFDDRDGAKPVPAAVTALWRPFRAVRLTKPVRT